ncbi:hypothetical protein C8J23_11485 [Shewanella chilikensis]|jgi:penicillin-binding protein 1B|uniref:Uncharacterized protein n=1 Tax=Shewanella chilikensis TaxID=558541 RepID=A0ABX5PNH1_9GAMM|nr:hypothetical protein [Shewanella sp.]PYE58439.1 hypothetical protein C8J23_11485 [Shewanella chilikensis]
MHFLDPMAQEAAENGVERSLKELGKKEKEVQVGIVVV